jgi:hypothetical protein
MSEQDKDWTKGSPPAVDLSKLRDRLADLHSLLARNEISGALAEVDEPRRELGTDGDRLEGVHHLIVVGESTSAQAELEGVMAELDGITGEAA